MYLDKKYFESWMERIIERLDRMEKMQEKPPLEVPSVLPDGDKLLDNFDLCQMLNVSKRTLQRYRSLGELPYERIYHKTFYKQKDVLKFIETHFSRFRAMKKKKK